METLQKDEKKSNTSVGLNVRNDKLQLPSEDRPQF